MKSELIIEWRHAGGGHGEGGMPLPAVFAEIRMLLEMEGIGVRVIETVLPGGAAAEPESLLFNGVPIEELLKGVEVTPVSCGSCSCTTCEEGEECRMIRYSGERYEAIPPDLIGRAAAKALEMD
ncbi:MAG: DUF2703 domain-containing protein [Methanomicrobiales archaeon]|nr:DUF2703 domain-containing protein [Methanomicrobiales archaeon]